VTNGNPAGDPVLATGHGKDLISPYLTRSRPFAACRTASATASASRTTAPLRTS